MPTLTLTEINIYPVKSLGGIALKEAQVTGKGLVLDRRWMLVDDAGVFMTQRINPKMALFKLSLTGNTIVINHLGDTLSISNEDAYLPEPLQVKIWDDTVQAFEVNKAHSRWFTERLGLSSRLVFFPEENPRAVDPKYKVNDEHVSLADAYPFLIIGQSSLDDLNTRLASGVPMNRFRPNFVFTGGAPYEEEQWRNFNIGTVPFVGVKPCARCVLTTVNQDTAEKGIEPLLTLSKYRKVENKVLFGMNLVARQDGVVRVGDVLQLN